MSAGQARESGLGGAQPQAAAGRAVRVLLARPAGLLGGCGGRGRAGRGAVLADVLARLRNAAVLAPACPAVIAPGLGALARQVALILPCPNPLSRSHFHCLPLLPPGLTGVSPDAPAVAKYKAEVHYGSGTGGVHEIEPSTAWNPATLVRCCAALYRLPRRLFLDKDEKRFSWERGEKDLHLTGREWRCRGKCLHWGVKGYSAAALRCTAGLCGGPMVAGRARMRCIVLEPTAGAGMLVHCCRAASAWCPTRASCSTTCTTTSSWRVRAAH